MNTDLEVPLSELDLFGLPPTQKSVTQTIETSHRPASHIGKLQNRHESEFEIRLADDEYLLMHETFIYFKCLLEEADKPLIVKKDSIAAFEVSNNLLHSMIDRVRVAVGTTGELVDIQNYAYKAYIETLLGYGDNAKSTHLRCALWEEDDDERIKHIFKYNSTEQKYTAQTFELMGRLHYDFSHQNRAIIGGSKVAVKVQFHKHNFFLNTGTQKVNLKISDALLYAKRFKVTESKVKAHRRALEQAPARYPLTTSRVFTQNIPQGTVSTHCDNIINGILPNRLFVAFVKKNDFAGAKISSPFNFIPASVNYISCYVDGVQLPSSSIQVEPENGLYITAYSRLFDVLNQSDTDPCCDITLKEFITDKCFFAFTLSADQSDGYSIGGHWNLPKKGRLQIEVKFTDNSEELVLLAFAEFNTLYQIDSFRNLAIVPL